MRVKSIKERAPWRNRALFGIVGKVSGMKLPDVAWTFMHRPKLFGKPFGTWIDLIMRGESIWSRGERELFASYTAHLQECEW